jgi:DNA-binding FadR family transcriptional regulator
MIVSSDVATGAIRNEPAYRLVVRSIESKIMSGEWSVGDRVPSETTLAGDFGVHRSTVREAIRVLEQNGLVRRHDGGKLLYVTAPREADISARITAAIVLHEISFFELWESMRCFEPVLTECAARRIDDETLDLLQVNVEKTRAGLDDMQGLVTLDIEFHQIIARASRNRALQLCRQPISQLFYPAFSKVLTSLSAGERLLFAHENILQALRNRDAPGARVWMDKHIVDFRRGYELAKLDIDTPADWPM